MVLVERADTGLANILNVLAVLQQRDDLQAVQALLRGADLDVALQFVNYR